MRAFAADSDSSLFGTTEFSSAKVGEFREWSSMLQRFDGELTSPENKRIVGRWQRTLQPLKDLPLEKKAARVNDMMNRLPYAPDEVTMGKIDDWATPIEFMARGRGDCEDYAIAKYASLKALGVPEEKMRIVVLEDMAKNIPHAVLAVYAESGVLILDNQAKAVRYDTQISTYDPVYSINSRNFWVHGRRVAEMKTEQLSGAGM